MARTRPERGHVMRRSHKYSLGSCLCKTLLWLFVAVVVSCVPARAQVGANVSGVISDSSGATITGATVTITNTSNGISQTLSTGTGGYYRAVNMQPAPYTITVEAHGFANQKKTATLLVGSDLTVDFTMSVGQETQAVLVTGE